MKLTAKIKLNPTEEQQRFLHDILQGANATPLTYVISRKNFEKGLFFFYRKGTKKIFI